MLNTRRYSRGAVKVVACLVLALVLLAGAGHASPAAPAPPLLVVSSDYTQWSENHAFLYTPGGKLRALALGAGATASPDGRLVGFVRGRELWTVHATGSGARRVAIAFVARDEAGRAKVVLVHPDGTGVRELGAGAAFPSALSWSSDGRLAWLASSRVQVATPDGAVRTVARVQGIAWPEPALAWSPDGRSLAVRARGSAIALVFGDAYGVRRVDVSSRGVQPIDVGPDVFRPVISPDGSELAFLSVRGECYFRDPDAWGVFVSSVDGTNVRRITSNDKFGPRSWSPDQSLVAASDGYRLELVDVATGTRRSLLGAGYTAEAAFAPTSAPAR
jgi:Tol biopolymer transport system component